MANVAIVVGHHPDAPGAPLTVGEHTTHEYPLWSPFAHELRQTLKAEGVNATVIERPAPTAFTALAEEINASGADCALSLHFNAADDPEAEGTEMIHYKGSTAGRRLAMLLQGETVQALGTEDRRVIGRTDLEVLRLTEMPAVVCEPAFGSHEADAWRLLTRQTDLLLAYRKAVIDFLDGEGARKQQEGSA